MHPKINRQAHRLKTVIRSHRHSSSFHVVLHFRYNDAVKHIMVTRGPPDNLYGLAPKYYLYQSLQDLVEHYHKNSLELHNRELKTCLKLPVRFVHSDR